MSDDASVWLDHHEKEIKKRDARIAQLEAEKARLEGERDAYLRRWADLCWRRSELEAALREAREDLRHYWHDGGDSMFVDAAEKVLDRALAGGEKEAPPQLCQCGHLYARHYGDDGHWQCAECMDDCKAKGFAPGQGAQRPEAKDVRRYDEPGSNYPATTAKDPAEEPIDRAEYEAWEREQKSQQPEAPKCTCILRWNRPCPVHDPAQGETEHDEALRLLELGLHCSGGFALHSWKAAVRDFLSRTPRPVQPGTSRG